MCTISVCTLWGTFISKHFQPLHVYTLSQLGFVEPGARDTSFADWKKSNFRRSKNKNCTIFGYHADVVFYCNSKAKKAALISYLRLFV